MMFEFDSFCEWCYQAYITRNDPPINKPMTEPTPVVPPTPQNQPVDENSAPTPSFPPKVVLWAQAIAKWEGDVTGHDAGNLKYSGLTKSWGATKGRAAQDGGYFAIFSDDGMNALCNFLVLGCEDELVAFHSPEARTLIGFTKIYAGNPPQGYIDGIIDALGVPASTPIALFLDS